MKVAVEDGGDTVARRTASDCDLHVVTGTRADGRLRRASDPRKVTLLVKHSQRDSPAADAAGAPHAVSVCRLVRSPKRGTIGIPRDASVPHRKLRGRTLSFSTVPQRDIGAAR